MLDIPWLKQQVQSQQLMHRSPHTTSGYRLKPISQNKSPNMKTASRAKATMTVTKAAK
jgi:hypothetical protein